MHRSCPALGGKRPVTALFVQVACGGACSGALGVQHTAVGGRSSPALTLVAAQDLRRPPTTTQAPAPASAQCGVVWYCCEALVVSVAASPQLWRMFSAAATLPADQAHGPAQAPMVARLTRPLNPHQHSAHAHTVGFHCDGTKVTWSPHLCRLTHSQRGAFPAGDARSEPACGRGRFLPSWSASSSTMAARLHRVLVPCQAASLAGCTAAVPAASRVCRGMAR